MISKAVLVAGLVAGITLAAGPATAASATSQPFSLSVSPGRLAAGKPGSVRRLTVSNNGSKPVTVRAELSELSRNAAGRCAVGPLGNVTWATVRPLSFTVPPGGQQIATVTIGRHVPTGTHDLVTAFVAVPGSTTGVTVSGAVGAQMQVQGNSRQTSTRRPCLSLPAPPKTAHTSAAAPSTVHKFPWTLAALGLAVLAVIALTLALIFMRRRWTQESGRSAR